MPLTKGKHIVEEINGIRCTIVEKGVDSGRIAFLKDLLEFNKFEVNVQEDKRENEEVPVTYTIGVTDLIFNPVTADYEMSLKTRDGKKVSPAYWNQYTTEIDNRYWRFRRK
jgi:hypothetical protein